MKQKIFIGIPSRDPLKQSLVGGLADLLRELATDQNFHVTIERNSGYPVDRVRNSLVESFLKSECDYILMIDDDIVPPRDILAMAEHQCAIVAALCYAWNPSIGVFPVAYKKTDDPLKPYSRPGIGNAIERKGLLAMDLVGTGCLMIHRDVFGQVERPFFHTILNDDMTRLIDSEDFSFCKKARAAEIDIYVDTNKICSHMKAVDLRVVARWAEDMRQRSERLGYTRLLQRPQARV